MSSNDLAIRIRGLGKAYTIRHNQESHTTLAEAALARLRHPLRRTQKQTFWALKDIDLDIHKGDVVGIIGRNGAGKSTLLKVLSRITSPTVGQVDLFGRVGSLLEVGTGFHPELTGRENIYLNGSILGMKKAEIDTQFDAIVDFAGVEQFLDTPVKRYSSGMAVRLAFAVAAHLRTEILIVDEVLAVGDAIFQKKCLGKMQDVASGEGRTVLFVSHNMAMVEALCQRGVFLEHGRIRCNKSAYEALADYRTCLETVGQEADQSHDTPIGRIEVTVRPTSASSSESIEAGDPFVIQVNASLSRRLDRPRLGFGINDDAGRRIFTLHSDHWPAGLPSLKGDCSISCHCEQPRLSPGRYFIKAAIGDAGGDIWEADPAATFSVISADAYGTGRLPERQQGPVLGQSKCIVHTEAAVVMQ